MERPSIAIIGAGRLGTALAQRLAEAKYGTKILPGRKYSKPLRSDVVWFCVPDAAIELAANIFPQLGWKGKYAFHSSGVLSSTALTTPRAAGARVASVHPLMTFVKGSAPDL